MLIKSIVFLTFCYMAARIIPIIKTIRHVEDKRVLREFLNNLRDNININIDNVIFIIGDRFATIRLFKYFSTIEYDRKLKDYEDFEICYKLSHEIAHIEFETDKFSRNLFLSYKLKRIKHMIDEIFCDIRGRQISNLTSSEIELYFKNNDMRFKLAGDEKVAWEDGYFVSSLRSYFVKKYYDSYVNNMLDIESFGNEIVEEYNRICKKLCRDDQCIKDTDIIINWIKDKYG